MQSERVVVLYRPQTAALTSVFVRYIIFRERHEFVPGLHCRIGRIKRSDEPKVIEIRKRQEMISIRPTVGFDLVIFFLGFEE